MKVQIKPALESEKAHFEAMLPGYLRELGVEGEYPYLPLYWQEPGRFAYLLLVEGDIAGFALVRQQQELTEYELAEFYVASDYRLAGVGHAAAQALFALHSGRWELSVLADNLAGLRFWPKVLPAGAQVQTIETPEGVRYLQFEFVSV
ncbi:MULTISPECIES: GNAT family N-acetyltransferase [Pseudomonas]|uniref:GNAT family N-acetyltransferase n=1 Tax=Pseudomonas TaxID=286 RepID=UPI000299FBE8|nr:MULTISPECIES: GNAT family N-acetyltransferase [Pseudomonas]MBS7596677.1 GNAT family N-acetyltransferase [Pseudomonas sp. RC2C2]PJY96598.1 GNAT family N-acetyltransferase [Pseudomonas donghuensis]UVL22566.1 GNAT family N-acetyltransferase [Pseudomonas donghuensis]WKY26534.1 GNAT family N-acetyltransferase [Pseudomonas donghuensis]